MFQKVNISLCSPGALRLADYEIQYHSFPYKTSLHSRVSRLNELFNGSEQSQLSFCLAFIEQILLSRRHFKVGIEFYKKKNKKKKKKKKSPYAEAAVHEKLFKAQISYYCSVLINAPILIMTRFFSNFSRK